MKVVEVLEVMLKASKRPDPSVKSNTRLKWLTEDIKMNESMVHPNQTEYNKINMLSILS
jgi:hypothetical protein